MKKRNKYIPSDKERRKYVSSMRNRIFAGLIAAVTAASPVITTAASLEDIQSHLKQMEVLKAWM